MYYYIIPNIFSVLVLSEVRVIGRDSVSENLLSQGRVPTIFEMGEPTYIITKK
jgi:hypothetical protein